MGIDISISFKTGDAPKDVRRDFRQLDKALHENEANALDETVADIHDLAAFLAPVKSGRLKRSIGSEVETSGTTLRGYVGSNLDYSKWVETGTRPHEIGFGLRFKWPNAPPSEVAYFKSIGSYPYFMYDTVSHPGTSPQPFLAPAVETHRSTFRANIITAAIDAESDAGGER